MKQKERSLIFYDYFRAHTESGQWIPSQVLRGSAIYKETLQSALRPLTSSRVYVLSPEVVKLALELTNKAGKAPVPYLSYPRYPTWVEFGGDITIGDKNTQYKAVWAFPALDREKTVHFDLITLDEQAKSLFVREDGRSWWYQQRGTCEGEYKMCPRARQTVEGELYEIASNEAQALIVQECECAGAGWQWAQFIFLIGHLLHLPGEIKESVTKRDLPLPRNFHARQQMEAENKRYPRYTTLSLSHPLEVHAMAKRSKSGIGSTGDVSNYLETQQVAGSWRALIPGEGKPWKELQVLYVESYRRKGRIGDTSLNRYSIEP